MASVFRGEKRILLVDFLRQGHTVNAANYCETLKGLRLSIKNKIRAMLTSKV